MTKYRIFFFLSSSIVLISLIWFIFGYSIFVNYKSIDREREKLLGIADLFIACFIFMLFSFLLLWIGFIMFLKSKRTLQDLKVRDPKVKWKQKDWIIFIILVSVSIFIMTLGIIIILFTIGK